MRMSEHRARTEENTYEICVTKSNGEMTYGAELYAKE